MASPRAARRHRHGDETPSARYVTGRPSPIDPLLDTAPCGFLSFADDGTLRVVNRTLCDLLGYRADELAGRHVEMVMTIGTRIFYQTHFFPLLRLHGHAEEIFLLLRAKSGEDLAAIANAVRRERDGGWITDCVLLQVKERRKFEDALLKARKDAEEAMKEANAHRREVEEANELLERQALELELSQQQLVEQAVELEKQRKVAEEANRAKSVFLAMMSHELRTPLNAIGGYVQLIEMGVHGPVTEAQAAALERIAKAQQHLLRLINDVLNLARIEAGRVEFELAPFPLKDAVDGVLPMVEPQLAARRIHHEVNVAATLVARADRAKVQQIVLNLLSNAAKFTPADGRVSVEASADPVQPGRLLLRVTDTGIGIPADRLGQVFEPFVQVDESPASRAEGTGLGLAISRDLARGMGGDLSVESELGVGSTFTLALPSA